MTEELLKAMPVLFCMRFYWMTGETECSLIAMAVGVGFAILGKFHDLN